MAATAVGNKVEADVPLLGDTDDGDVALDPGYESGGQGASLVQHESQGLAATRDLLCDHGGATIAADFFVVTEGQVDRPPRLEAFGQKAFYGFELGEDIDLVVECSAAPDGSFGDGSRECGVLPVGFGSRFDGHDVGVSSEQHRREAGLPALPSVQEAQFGDGFALQFFVNTRKLGFQERVQGEKSLGVALGFFEVGDRGDLQGLAEARSHGVVV